MACADSGCCGPESGFSCLPLVLASLIYAPSPFKSQRLAKGMVRAVQHSLVGFCCPRKGSAMSTASSASEEFAVRSDSQDARLQLLKRLDGARLSSFHRSEERRVGKECRSR